MNLGVCYFFKDRSIVQPNLATSGDNVENVLDILCSAKAILNATCVTRVAIYRQASGLISN